MVLVLPVLCFLVAMVLAALGLRYKAGWLTALCVFGSLAGYAWAHNAAQAPGFQAIDDQVYAFLIFAPACVGAVIGAGFGWWKWRRI